MIPSIPQTDVVPTSSIPEEADYQNLRIVRCQTDSKAAEHYKSNRYQFQLEPGKYNILRGTLCRKGFVKRDNQYRLTLTLHPNLREFLALVIYDPSNPPPDSYEALGMAQAHNQTQADFKGAKKKNKTDFTEYLTEGIRCKRIPYLPTISGWQSRKAFPDTVFVAFDEGDPNALYGMAYIPKKPVMQSDGQTQTAALFALANTKEAVSSGALDGFTVTVEVELNLNERQAGQSFADRNGRGTKKNRNLVIGLDTSSALSHIRVRALKNTVFENRVATGRGGGTSVTATGNIADLSTIEQMILRIINPDGGLKPEHVKHHHIEYYQDLCHDLFRLLGEVFGSDWDANPGKKQDPFRRLYIHGWPFALKAIASAYHYARVNELGPLLKALKSRGHSARLTKEEAFAAAVKAAREDWDEQPEIGLVDFKRRLEAIDWLRYRAHWIPITGFSQKDGKKKTFKLKATGEMQVVGRVPHSFATIDAVISVLTTDRWKDFTSDVNVPIDG